MLSFWAEKSYTNETNNIKSQSQVSLIVLYNLTKTFYKLQTELKCLKNCT